MALNVTIKPCASTALAVAMAETSRRARLAAVHRLVEEVDRELRIDYGNAFAIVTYEAQRAICACGASFSQPHEMRRHLIQHAAEATDQGTPIHREVEAGMSYAELAEMLGVNSARVQQLIAKGRVLVLGLTDGDGDREAVSA